MVLLTVFITGCIGRVERMNVSNQIGTSRSSAMRTHAFGGSTKVSA